MGIGNIEVHVPIRTIEVSVPAPATVLGSHDETLLFLRRISRVHLLRRLALGVGVGDAMVVSPTVFTMRGRRWRKDYGSMAIILIQIA